MFTRIFIERPILSSVVSLFLAIIGALMIPMLPIEKLPDITPPMVQVTATYPGASADVLTQTVISPMEQQINGVDNMIYMYSRAGSDGTCVIRVSFEIGTNPDMATVNVQNRVQRAMAQLPEEVQRQGVIVKKASSSFVTVVSLQGDRGQYDSTFLSNFAKTRVRDELARIPGVGDTNIPGEMAFSMRVWLDPDQLEVRGLSSQDVIDAIKEQNVQVAAGRIGAAPSAPEQPFALTITTLGRLASVEQFRDIIIRAGQNGAVLRLGDIARVEMGAENYEGFSRVNGKPAAIIMCYQAPGANAVQIANDTRRTMKELSKTFPVGLEYKVVFDSSEFVKVSLEEVLHTLLEAFVLVMLCVFIFLQDWRATLIPAVAIPVSILATFFVMYLMGFTINTLSLFGMVLAIGIVVDDAVIVVENVAHHLEHGVKSTKEATFRAMNEVSGPIIATTLVLMSVFVPTAVLPGITGQLYRQFAITIAISVGFSAITALTTSPALAAILMKPPTKRKNALFRGFNYAFDGLTSRYRWAVRILVGHVIFTLIGLAVVFGGFSWLISSIPTGFIPDEDEGYFFVHVQLPAAASLERTNAALMQMDQALMGLDGVEDVITMGGYSLLDSANVNNVGGYIVMLKHWKDREEASRSIEAIVAKARSTLTEFPEATTFPFRPPAITGLGNASGLSYQMLDQASVGPKVMAEAKMDLLREFPEHPALIALTTTDQGYIPSIYVSIDREKVKQMGLSLSAVNSTLQANLAGAYVNDFNMFDRPWKVYTLAESRFRRTAQDIGRLWVTSPEGNRIPLGSIAEIRDSLAPLAMERFNLYPTISFTGIPRPGYSTGQGVEAMKEMSRHLPDGIAYAWTNMTYQEIKAGNMAPIVFALAFLFVFLILAAQYESWTTPIAVLLSVPAGQAGALLLTWLRGFDNNIYTQIGLVMLI
ncbi:MAG TPA: efflux RND transporter permease subunit, partial [Tepidisphaeraceae bacterium]|nr:efflux RND transporter permease subunit [Tepidisphaeraceae bacterium]